MKSLALCIPSIPGVLGVWGITGGMWYSTGVLVENDGRRHGAGQHCQEPRQGS